MPVLGHGPNRNYNLAQRYSNVTVLDTIEHNDNHLEDDDIYTDPELLQVTRFSADNIHVSDGNFQGDPIPEEHELSPMEEVSFRDKNPHDIAIDIVNIQNQQDPDVLKAELAQQNEYANYKAVNSKYEYGKKKKTIWKIYSDSTIILTSAIDLNTIFFARIYQKICDENFSEALIHGKWNDCSSILVNAFLEAGVLQLGSQYLKKVKNHVTDVLKSIATNLGFFTGINSTVFQAILPKIIGGGIAALFISFLDPQDDVQYYGAVVNAFICLSLNWMWAVPLSAIVGKYVEVYSSLKNEDDCKRTTLWKIRQTLYHTLRELPVISGFLWLDNLNTRRPLPTRYEVIDIDNVPEIFCCAISYERLKDPVFLHGSVYERKHILRWLKMNNHHPQSRNFATKYQIVPPPTEYMEAFNSFTNRYEAALASR